jgi:hypothetical protein
MSPGASSILEQSPGLEAGGIWHLLYNSGTKRHGSTGNPHLGQPHDEIHGTNGMLVAGSCPLQTNSRGYDVVRASYIGAEDVHCGIGVVS